MARCARRPTVLAAICERLRRMSRASARLGQGGGCDATAATHFAYDEADAAAAAADEAAADEDAAGLPEESLVLSPGFGLTPRVAISFVTAWRHERYAPVSTVGAAFLFLYRPRRGWW